MEEKIRNGIRIRKTVEDDAGLIAEIENDPEVKKFLGGPTRRSEAQYRESFAKMQKPYEHLTIDSLANNKPIGRCGLIVSENESEIHIVLAKQYWKQNLGSEVALALAQLSAERYPEKMLIAKVHPDNVAAISILKNLGMAQSGTINKLGSYDNGFLRFEKGEEVRK